MGFLGDMGNFIRDIGYNFTVGQENNPYMLDPQEEILAEQYLDQNPDTDWTGIAGYEQVQKKYKDRMKKQNPFMDNFPKGSKSKEGQEKTRKDQRDDIPLYNEDPFAPRPDVVMTANGLRRVRKSQKEVTYDRLKAKEKIGPLSKHEQEWLDAYYGKSKSTRGPKSAEDRMRIRKLAKELAQDANEKALGPDADPWDLEDTEPSEEQIAAKLAEATQYLYPYTDVSEMLQKGKVNYDIQLPSNIKKTSQALKYLVEKVGMDELEAKEWLSERLKAK